ncbi:pseudouridine synthase [Hymenobacter psoromatis]|uniref:pseudouridine synthase n=1 Tax=Hymenobacter psoromatis TaxID=1484116 RepID=UPI001CBEDDDE|nr:pseudouridine synthase [Hymenobacter psoromatis]
MGKQHSSDDKPGRRGPGRPGGDARGGAPRSGGNYKGSRPDGRSEGYSPARPTFGQGGGKSGGRPAGGGSSSFGEKRSFGGDRPERGSYSDRRGAVSGDRPERGNSSSGEKRSFGGDRGGSGEKRSFGGDRPERGGYGEKRSFSSGRPERGNSSYGEKRSFNGDRPARSFGDRDREARPLRPEQAERGERPAYPPKPIWQGQPVRYEGKPTVPRGTQGERNRKFIKTNPDGTPVEGPQLGSERPAYTGRDERRSFEERDNTRPTPRPRPESSDERAPRREYGARAGADDRRGGYPDRRPASGPASERRSFGGEREGRERGGYQSREDRPANASRDDRRSGSADRDRAAGSFDKPRSYGERPASGGSGTFRERREAMRDAQSGPRRGTGYGSKSSTGDQVGQAPDYKNLSHYEQDKNRGNKRRRDDEDFGTEELRLNRYIANAGICSRREADALIAAGEIRVNGEVITEMGYKVQPADTVQYGKTNLNREKLVYVLLNKPKDFITTTDDPEGRKTVMDLVAKASKERIFPVGRLDRNTTGLLLFTNDGEVAQKLSHPSHKNKKIYQAELDKPLTAEHLAQITAGVELEDGKAEVDDVAVVAGNPHFVGIELHVGRNRIVRRIFEHLGYDVVALDRVQYAGLTKKELSRGNWRFLTEQEVIRLKYFM